MGSAGTFDRISSRIATLSKSEVKRHLLNFKGSVKFDYTESYLDSLSTDSLRHILLAAMTTFKRKRI